eukprot:6210848-Pleurochrysis_carterae.AAC.3
MAVRTLLLCAAVGSAAALTAPVTRAVRPAVRRTTDVQAVVNFDSAASQWNAEFPYLAKFGFGPSAKAERWNGRHAMFGCTHHDLFRWVVIVATGYAQSHGLIPSPDVPLSYSSWGGLAQVAIHTHHQDHASKDVFLLWCGPRGYRAQSFLAGARACQENC